MNKKIHVFGIRMTDYFILVFKTLAIRISIHQIKSLKNKLLHRLLTILIMTNNFSTLMLNTIKTRKTILKITYYLNRENYFLKKCKAVV